MSDKRLTPVNDRIVAAGLAKAYPDRKSVTSKRMFVSVPVVDLRCTLGGSRDRQLVYGAPFDLLERRDGWAFGIAVAAQYVGWIPETAIRQNADRGEARDRVCTRTTHVYSQPSFKSPESSALSGQSLLCAGATHDRFTETELGWVPTKHLTRKRDQDPAAVAEKYLGTPYLWGGNSGFGIDCSGLVQAALLACDMPCPGDSDLQEQSLGDTLGDEPVQRGDLFFWKGHVAMAADTTTLIHANAHDMAVVYEPITSAISRIAAQGEGPVTRRARLKLT